jgi:hypothetical protein
MNGFMQRSSAAGAAPILPTGPRPHPPPRRPGGLDVSHSVRIRPLALACALALLAALPAGALAANGGASADGAASAQGASGSVGAAVGVAVPAHRTSAGRHRRVGGASAKRRHRARRDPAPAVPAPAAPGTSQVPPALATLRDDGTAVSPAGAPAAVAGGGGGGRGEGPLVSRRRSPPPTASPRCPTAGAAGMRDGRTSATTAPARSATRCTAPGCSTRARPPAS